MFAVRRNNDARIVVLLACFAGSFGDEMRRALTPWIVLAVFGLIAGGAYRYFANDPSEGTLANYLRSSLHGMGVTLSAWAVHLHFTSRSSEWVRRWPLVIEIVVQSAAMAVFVLGGRPCVLDGVCGRQGACVGRRPPPSCRRSCPPFPPPCLRGACSS